MTQILKYLYIILPIVCIKLNAQNTLVIDSLKSELGILINNEKLTFWSSNEHSEGNYQLNITERIKFSQSSLVIKTEKEIKTIDLVDLQNCIYSDAREVYILSALSLKSLIMIVFPEIKSPYGTKKAEREQIKKSEEIKTLYNKLCNLQNKLRDEYYSKETISFQTTIKEKQLLNENLTLSEEQRKYIVQASAFNDSKEYLKALIYYEKAMELNPTSYPSGYFNMALLAAQMKRYNYAIMSMKKYLILMPDAEDSRKAQDKIYEWEIYLK